jgi:hypothetical protein
MYGVHERYLAVRIFHHQAVGAGQKKNAKLAVPGNRRDVFIQHCLYRPAGFEV